MVSLKYANVNTPVPGPEWRKLSDADRQARVAKALQSSTQAFNGAVVIVSAKEDGQVTVNLTEPLPPARRGQLLLDLEEFLKQEIDQGLSIWLEPLGDRNSLRNLRGIEVKA
jgi:hypothetical protein